MRRSLIVVCGFLLPCNTSGAQELSSVRPSAATKVSFSIPALPLVSALRPTGDPGPPSSKSPSVAMGAAQHPSMDGDQMGSTSVPIDSWIYPALERLAALGAIPSQSVSIRPWTRQECRRQLREAEDLLYGMGSLDAPIDAGAREEAARSLSQLESALREPDGSAVAALESVYMRYGSIMGPGLTDSFHFGQTWRNDFGRPLGRGGSYIAGYSARAVAGRFFLYDRQELQTDPGLPAVSQQQSDLFDQLDNRDFGSVAPNFSYTASAIPAYIRQRPLELYAGVAFAGNQLSFGKQSINWGPTTGGSFSFSDNAEPTYNLRLVATRPHPFPLLPGLGSYRYDVFFGKLSGHHYPARPYFNGFKADLMFGRYLELGFSRWSILWGVGHPMTFHSLKANIFSSNSTGTGTYGDRNDPGDRKSSFDFRFHVPGVSNYMTLYAEAYADDEVNPIDAPRRVAWQPGVYFARLPGLPHMDLRVEAASSQELSKDEGGGTRFFINNEYRDGNTNKGFLLGNAVGRDGRSIEGRLGYWASARTKFEGGYRQTKVSRTFLPNGGTVTDGFASASYAFGSDWTADAFVQYERFLMPSYLAGAQRNGSARLQLTWTPTDRSARHE